MKLQMESRSKLAVVLVCLFVLTYCQDNTTILDELELECVQGLAEVGQAFNSSCPSDLLDALQLGVLVPDLCNDESCIVTMSQLFSMCGNKNYINNFCERHSLISIQVVCDDNCAQMRFDPATNHTLCAACNTGFELPSCCHCASEYVLQDSICVDRGVATCPENCIGFFSAGGPPKCTQCIDGYGSLPHCCHKVNCEGTCDLEVHDSEHDSTHCDICKTGYTYSRHTTPRNCCNCASGYAVLDSICVEPCQENIAYGSTCKSGFAAPSCCRCIIGYAREGSICNRVCSSNCAPGHHDPHIGCTKCSLESTSPPTCCDKCHQVFFDTECESLQIDPPIIVQTRRVHSVSIQEGTSVVLGDITLHPPLRYIYLSSPHIGILNDTAHLDCIASIINQNGSSYQPEVSMIVTWTTTLKCQAIISTNGRESFVIFRYDNVSGERQSESFIVTMDLEQGSHYGNVVFFDNIDMEQHIHRLDLEFQMDHPDLLPFGIGNGDQLLLDPLFAPSIFYAPSVIFFQNEEAILFVSDSGVMSFEGLLPIKEVCDHGGCSSGHPRPNFRNVPLESVIAPFWADIQSSVFHRTTTNETILNHVAEIITDANTNLQQYQPEIAIIVTWLASSHFSYTFTFQAVLSTDGRRSFAIFIYDNLASFAFIQPHEIGFNAGDGVRTQRIDLNFLDSVSVFRLDGECVTRVKPGNACPLNSLVTTCDEQELTAQKCICDLGENSTLCLPFFPFGSRSNDSFIEQAVSKAEGPINIPVPFPFYRNKEKKLFISTNGLISFRDGYNSFRVSTLPRLSSDALPLIALFWADFNFRDQGSIFYRVTSDAATLARAKELITENGLLQSFDDFSPSLAIVITWDNVVLLSRMLDDTKFRFQGILVTDGAASFLLFLYENVPTIRKITSLERAVVGFDAGDQSRGETLLYGNEMFELTSSNAFRIDGNCMTENRHSCPLRSTSLQCDADFRVRLCLCAPTISDPLCHLSHFFPFGSEIDTLGPQDIDASVKIDIRKNIMLFNKQQQILYVSTNGFISFEGEFDYKPYDVRSFTSDSLQYPMVAPLWADFNFREEGALYYRVTNDNNTLNAISERIAAQNPNYAAFEPAEAVIVTWFQSRIFESEFTTNFQAVLATDGDISFAIYLYDDDDTGYLPSPHAEMRGFTAADTRRAHNSRRGTRELLFCIDGECIVELSDDRCGLHSIPIRCDTQVTSSCLCKRGYKPSNGSCLEFLQFGARAGDTTQFQMPPADVELPMTFKFYEESETHIVIHPNGQVLFTANTMDDVSAAVLMYPLMYRKRIDRDGSLVVIHYRILTSHEDREALMEVDSLIVEVNEDLGGYVSSLAVVATWQTDKVEPGNAQLILTTNGYVSFAVMNYEASPLEANADVQNKIGFRSLTGAFSYLERVEQVNIFRIDGQCITSALPGSVCLLNSLAAECDSLEAVNCSCSTGYQPRDALNCIDINECENDLCDQLCVNTTGSYHCDCHDGFVLKNDQVTCQDIDECASESRCSHECENSIGSFHCICNPGYYLISDGFTCRDVDECNSTICDHECTNTNGSFVCSCNDGYSLNQDNLTCSVAVAASSTLEVSLGIVFGGLAAVVVLFIIALAVWMCIAHRRRKTKTLISRGYIQSDAAENMHNLRQFSVQSSFKLNIPESLIMPSCNLKLGSTLGQGEFGVVYKARIKNSVSDTITNTVAVKTLKGFIEKELVRELLRECSRMYNFDHPNVLKLLGVCLDGGPAPYIIMPFMANGSLLSFLKKERENILLDPDTTDSNDAISVEKRLLDMCNQIAKGMEYLAGKRVIHRDLAARNCMMDLNFVIQVADFGLATSLDTSKDYFRQDQNDAIKLPFKWMAPESIHDRIFSEKSDVWSYGVTCWEIFSGGKTPYPGIQFAELPQQLTKGLRMEKPLNAACTDEMYSVMMKCWSSEVSSRPSFANLVVQLSSSLERMAEYFDFSAPEETLV